MPFDSLSTPALRLAFLAEVLRQPLLEDHIWDFGTVYEKNECGTVGCAIGIAHIIWPAAGLVNNGWAIEAKINEYFDLTENQIYACFFELGEEKLVTPIMVAERIERLITCRR